MLVSLRQLRLSILLLVLPPFLSIGCSPNPAQKHKTKSAADVLDEKPAETDSIAAQLLRFAGQTEFLNVEIRGGGVWEDEAPAEGAKEPAAEQREIQEADLFKLGLPGSKILYVLNNYRGLQVIDFSEGPAAPKILGRAAATGDELVEMYFATETMQIIVLERRWDTDAEDFRGRLLIYNVKDSHRPRLIQRIETQGDIADSRMVGSVLYVASRQKADTNQGEGWIKGYKIESAGLQEVSSYRLAMPVNNRKNMNIIETMEDGKPHYYLISVLQQNFFSWVGRQSAIEVVDITDPAGSIVPLLMVSAKGELLERSATTIKDHTLIAVSSSWMQDKNERWIRTVTVESFALPVNESPMIDQSEADFRRLWWEREMKHVPEGMDKEAYGEQLKNHPQFGLKGVFVKQNDGRIVKLFPDQSTTVGDDTGLHANLQDVRFVGDRVFVFWVPANMVDPLDVFDISKPLSEIRHLGRTLFPGWMERAIPIQYEGRDYILALGWVVPTTGDDRRIRPQVMIFEVQDKEGPAGLVTTVAQLTLESTKLWAFFNDEDKTIEVKMRPDGTGYIMFPAQSMETDNLSGGKLISYDLNSPNAKIQEGGFLAADAEWLRRVFSNPEIDKVHTLTDRSLGTFDLGAQGLSKPDEIMEAISTLELARDIVAYTKVKIGRQTYGVQIIDNGAARNENIQTILRLVKADWADAERGEVADQIELGGRYMSHIMSADGSLYVHTQQYLLNVTPAGNQWTTRSELRRIRWALDSEFQIVGPVVETVSWPNREREMLWNGQSVQFDLGDGRIFIAQGRTISLVNGSGQLAFTDESQVLNCLPEQAEQLQYHRLNQQIYVSYGVTVKSDNPLYRGVRLMRHYIAPFTESTLQLQCQAAINIPGRPLVREGQSLISEDQRFLGFETIGEGGVQDPSRIRLVRVLNALELLSGRAKLHDIYGMTETIDLMRDVSKGITLLERLDNGSAHAVVHLSITQHNHLFVRRSFVLPYVSSQREPLQLLSVFPAHPDMDLGKLYIVGSNTAAWQVFEEDGDILRARQVIEMLRPNERSTAMSSFDLFGWFGYLSDTERLARIVYEPELGRLTFAQGLWGIQQFEIVRDDI